MSESFFAKRSCESCGEDRVSRKTWGIGREYTSPSNMAAGSQPTLAAVLNIDSASLYGVKLKATFVLEQRNHKHTCAFTLGCICTLNPDLGFY